MAETMNTSNLETKRQLPVVSNETCFEAVNRHDVPCQRRSCKQWIDHSTGKNCMLLTTQSGPLTLNEIGQIYGLTRMRICQIEKGIYKKIRNFIR